MSATPGIIAQVRAAGGQVMMIEGRLKVRAEAVRRLAQIDPRTCRANVETRFSAPVMAAGYERVYRKLVEQDA